MKLSRISTIILAASWLAALFIFLSSPDSIPLHFDPGGQVDRTGHRSTVFILPGLASFLYLLLKGIARSSYVGGKSTGLSAEKAELLQRMGKKFLELLLLIILIIILFLLVLMYFVIQKRLTSLPVWYLSFIIAAIMIPTVIYVIKAGRIK